VNSQVYCQEVLDACHKMEACGMTVGTWGNISIRCDDEHFVITPSGMNYSTLSTEDIVTVSLQGEIVQGERKPSIEVGLHGSIYRARDDVRAILHTHPQFSTAFAIARKDIPPVSEELVQIVGEGVLCAKYALPGTDELAQYAVEALGDRSAVLVANHGAICVGDSIQQAFMVAEVLEKSSRAIIYASIVGQPHVISHKDCLMMRDFVANKYGQR